MSTMHLDLKPGDARRLVLPTGEIITMTLQRKSGQQARQGPARVAVSGGRSKASTRRILADRRSATPTTRT